MIFLALLMGVLVLTVLVFLTAYMHSEALFCSPKDELIYEKGKELKKFVSIVINHIQLENAFHVAGSFPVGSMFLLSSYKLIPSETITYTKEHTIHLLFWNYHKNQLYDDNTLRCILLHEIATFLAKEGEGTVEEVKENLVDTAIKLHYINVES